MLDREDRRVYRINWENNLRYEFAGTGENCTSTSASSCGDNYEDTQLSFNNPESMAFDPADTFISLTTENSKIDLAGTGALSDSCDSSGTGLFSSTIIGGNDCGSGSGNCEVDGLVGADVSLGYNLNLALDANQNLYFTSGDNIYEVQNIGTGIESTQTIHMVVGCLNNNINCLARPTESAPPPIPCSRG